MKKQRQLSRVPSISQNSYIEGKKTARSYVQLFVYAFSLKTYLHSDGFEIIGVVDVFDTLQK